MLVKEALEQGYQYERLFFEWPNVVLIDFHRRPSETAASVLRASRAERATTTLPF